VTVVLPHDRSRIWSVDGEDIVVTLLAGVREEGRILVAADSLATWQQEGYGETVEKLQQVPGQDLVYGIYGEGNRDIQFRQFLVESAFSTWGELVYKTPYEVDRLDIESVPHGFAVIVAGRLEGRIDIHTFRRFTVGGNDEASKFVGQNRLAAKIAWDVATAVAPSVDLEERFAVVMKSVVTSSHPFLEPPVHMWRITPECGCEHILGDG